MRHRSKRRSPRVAPCLPCCVNRAANSTAPMASLTSQAQLRASFAIPAGARTRAHRSANQQPRSMRPMLAAAGMYERSREGDDQRGQDRGCVGALALARGDRRRRAR